MAEEYQGLLPVGSYTLELLPNEPQLAVEAGTVRITLAAIDPENAEGDKPSTLRILKKVYDEDEDDLTYPVDEDEDSEEEEKPKNGKKDAKKNKKQQKKSEEDSEEDSDDDSFEISKTVICTLSPKVAYQQTLDIVINASDDIIFEVSGSYPIHLTGNYVMHPFDDEDSDDEDSDEDDSDDYDLSPDEDELDFSNRIQPVESEDDEEEEAPKETPKKEVKKEVKKQNKKRAAEEEAPAPVETKKQTKKQKSEDKKVAFSKELEQGPTGSTSAPAAKKGPVAKKLAGGVTIEDRKVGSGPTAQPGDKVSVRYIGKLLNGNIFDSNTKGKPFAFKLGAGEVIKGWDVGVAGMAVKGERRIVIPASSAYGKQSLPGIPANSTLSFDVKLVGIK
ncbi:hypothetical protein D0Z03_001760 [Geotrichum reessii]|nr:hypothetical protein D0Z03_001760 [Galactomyces reessii]